MLDRHHILEITGALQGRGDQDEQRHRAARGPGRKPMPIQAHHPIKGAEGQAKREERKSNEGRLAHPDGELRIAVVILTH